MKRLTETNSTINVMKQLINFTNYECFFYECIVCNQFDILLIGDSLKFNVHYCHNKLMLNATLSSILL